MKNERKGWLKKAGNRIVDITQKKIVNSVINSLSVPEDVIRRYLIDKNIPVEIIGFIIQQLNEGKKNLTESIKEEIKKYLSALDVSKEIQKILSKMVIEIKTEIRLVPSEDKKYKSNVKSTINVRYDDEEEK